MSIVKDHMFKILNSLPEDYFDNKTYAEMILLLMKEYLDKYGEDETTLIPGTNQHFTFETLKQTFNEN